MMIQCSCKEKIRDKNGTIVMYKLEDSYGNMQEIAPEVLKDAIRNRQIYVTDLKLTANNRLIGKREVTEGLRNAALFAGQVQMASRLKDAGHYDDQQRAYYVIANIDERYIRFRLKDKSELNRVYADMVTKKYIKCGKPKEINSGLYYTDIRIFDKMYTGLILEQHPEQLRVWMEKFGKLNIYEAILKSFDNINDKVLRDISIIKYYRDLEVLSKLCYRHKLTSAPLEDFLRNHKDLKELTVRIQLDDLREKKQKIRLSSEEYLLWDEQI